MSERHDGMVGVGRTAIVAAAMDGFCLVEDGRHIRAVNDVFCRMTGYSQTELLGMAVSDLEAAESAADVAAHYARLCERGADRFDSRHRRKDGSIIDVTVSVRVCPDEPRFAAAYVRDMTERRRAEEHAARTNDLLVNLARLVPGVIYQYRLYPDGRSAFPYSSPGMALIYEVAPEDVQADATPVFGRLHPDDYTMVASGIEASARTLETFYCEFRVVLPRQGLRWRWSQAQPQRMPDGGTLWHGIILDIHERKTAQLEKAALELQLQQAQKMESVGRLAGGVAHDFNNMLGVILGNAEIALDRVPEGHPLREDLEEIRGAATRSADLTRQLLAFARRQAIAPKVLNLVDTVGGLVTMLQRLIGESVRLDWRPDAALWPVRMDPSQVDQVLANLCINARDAMDGSGHLTIAVGNASLDAAFCAAFGAVEPGDYVRLSVTDTGSGMDEETQAHLFEPFFTTKAVGKGTGLGLATVYGIVKQNGGFVAVESVVGVGTVMTVYLPRHAGPAGRQGAAGPVGLLRRGRETVLLVEDEPAMLAMTSTLLEGMGYTVIAAGSAEEALRVAADRASEIRVLLTDVVMPDMNGRDLATIIAARYPHVAVVFMSGYTADVIASHGVLDDRVLFLQKPFTKEALAFRLSEALETAPNPPIA
jgi:two-component system, cell cycle sensor histidine kinase and response regulator CckA